MAKNHQIKCRTFHYWRRGNLNRISWRRL